MKNYITIALLGLSSSLTWAQSQVVNVYDEIADERGVFAMSMNVDIEDFFDEVIDINESQYHIEGDATKIQVMYVSETDDTRDLYRHLVRMLNQSDLDYIKIDSEDDEDVSIWMVRTGDHVSEIHLIAVDGDFESFVVATLLGDFEIQD